MNVVVVILGVPGKDDAPLGFAEPLPVAEDNSLDLINLAIVDAPVEKPVAPPLAVRIGVVQEYIRCSPFKMHVRLSLAGVGINAATGTGEVAGLLGPLPGRRDADDFVDKDENARRRAAGVMLARGISLVHVILTYFATGRLATNANILPCHGRRSSLINGTFDAKAFEELDGRHGARAAQLIHLKLACSKPNWPQKEPSMIKRKEWEKQAGEKIERAVTLVML
jgi:hypothetical protein